MLTDAQLLDIDPTFTQRTAAAKKKLNFDLDTGSFKKFLGLKDDEDVPPSFAEKILNATIPKGEHTVTVENPTSTGNKSVTMSDDKEADNYIGKIHPKANFFLNFSKKSKI